MSNAANDHLLTSKAGKYITLVFDVEAAEPREHR